MKLFILTLAAMIGAAGLAAQAPMIAPNHEPPTPDALQNYLQLTDLQVTDLTAVNAALREAVHPIRQQIREKQHELRGELRQEVPNTGLVGQIEVDIKNLKNEAAAIRADFMVQSRALLTSDQVAALGALENALSLVAPATQAVRANLIEPQEDFHFERGRRHSRSRGRMGGEREGGPRQPVQ